jgi:hypothetical protein
MGYHQRRLPLWEVIGQPLDDREFQRVQRYIEQNPVRAGVGGAAGGVCLVQRDAGPEPGGRLKA